ncbi:MAG: FAD-dependent oxidoreductase [bacterium]|nr:FAD-dependent oxidoreductase [bacterium]
MSKGDTTPEESPRDPGGLHEPLLEGAPGRLNPSPAERYNLVVLGGGPVGLAIAANAAALGAKVAIVEKGRLGEINFRAGSAPVLALARAARAICEVKRAADFGLRIGADATADFAAVLRYVREQAQTISERNGPDAMRKRGIDVFEGEGRFLARTHIQVGDKILEFSRAVIATGSRSFIPEIPGLAESGYLTGETTLELERPPRRLAIVGAGPMGCELAQAFARLGTQVCVYEREARILPRMDADAAALIQTALERDGVRFRLNHGALRISRAGEERTIESDGGTIRESCDQILVTAGRIPTSTDLNLPAAAIRFDESGVWVNSFLRTTNPRVFAAGNVCARYPFGHAADALARVVVANALFYGSARVAGLRLPQCVFTRPELACIGADQKTAERKHFAAIRFALDSLERTLVEHSGGGLLTLYYDRHRAIRGAVIVADHASELIGQIVMAMNRGGRVNSLAGDSHIHPTVSEIFQAAGDGYRRSLITPFMARFLRWLLTLRR